MTSKHDFTVRPGSLIRLTQYKDEVRDQIAVVVNIRHICAHEHDFCGFKRKSDDDIVVTLRRCTVGSLSARLSWEVLEYRVHDNIAAGVWQLLT